MRQRISRFWVLAALLLTMNAGALLWIRSEVLQRLAPTANDDALLVTLTTRDPQSAERLTFDFNKPVKGSVALDELVVNAPLMLQPQPLGYWQWQSAQRLDYVLAEPLPAGRKFRIVPVAYFAQETGQEVQLQGDVEFKTPRLEVLASRFKVADRDTVTLEFEFNQPVDPADLLRNLAIYNGPKLPQLGDKDRHEEALVVTSLDKKPGAVLRVQVARPTGLNLAARVSEKLTGRGAELGLESVYETEFTIVRKFRVESCRPYSNYHEMRDRSVRLTFTNYLAPQKFEGLKVVPQVDGLQIRKESWDHSSVVLTGPFESGVNYTFTIPATWLNEADQPLGLEDSVSITLPPREPVVRFTNDKGFLSPHGNLLVDLESAGVTGLRVEVSRVHENNLLAHLEGQPSTRTSRALFEKTLPVPAQGDRWQESIVDLKELLGSEQRGIYRLRASATNSSWTDDDCVICLTDIALTAKTERDALLILATSLRSAQPLEGVRVVAITGNNQTIGSAVTAANGLAQLPFDPHHPDGLPFVLMATKQDDASYLKLEDSEWVLDEVDQKGKPIPTTYEAMLYTERGVYRPGETLHVSGVLREANGKIPASFPLHITVTRPDGRLFNELTVTPKANEHGVFQFDVPTRESSRTGPYRIKVTLPGSTETLGSTLALVEAFEPVRIEVQATSEKSLWHAGEQPVLNINAKYLFGQPASGLKVNVTGAFRRGEFVSKELRGYSFAHSSQHVNREIQAIEQTLDEAGQARVEIPLPKELEPGWWGGNFIVTVTEESGRSISKAVSLTVDSVSRHVGVRRNGPAETVMIGQPFDVDWAIRSTIDTAAEPGVVDIVLQRVEYDWNWRRHRAGVGWEHTKRFVSHQSVTTDGTTAAGKTTFTVDQWGEYQISVIDQKSGNETLIRFYASGGYGESSVVTSNRPERVELVLDQTSYEPGSTAKLLLRSPFKGTGWICLESDRVRHHQLVTLTGTSMSLEVPVPADLRGGAFVSATVIRPVDPTEKTWLPHRAAGMLRLVVDHKAQHLPVSIDAPSQARPGDSITLVAHVGRRRNDADVAVNAIADAAANQSDIPLPEPRVKDESCRAMLHVWAVDEGILLTTGFKTPDPSGYFFAPRRSEIASADIFRDLLPDHQRAAGMQRIGGDSSETEELARSMSPSRRRESIVIWQKWVPVDASGMVTIDTVLPEHTGRLKWMAIAVADDTYGHSEYRTTLTAPLLVEASWPRFAAPGDQMQVPVKLFNSTSQPFDVQLQLQSSGPLTIAPRGDMTKITVAPQQPQLVWLDVATTGLGVGEVTVAAHAKSDEFGELTHQQNVKLPVRAAVAFGSESRVVTLKAGDRVTLEPPAGFVPEHSKQTLTVGPAPLLHLVPAVQALIQYPYGCAEQTTSALRGLLAAAQVFANEDELLTASIGQELSADQSQQQANLKNKREMIDSMIDAGVARLWAYQTQEGGIGYWGGTTAQPWLSAYVASVLADVKQYGRPVHPRFTDELMKYLSASLEGRNGVHPDANTQATICRVLAVYQKVPQGRMALLSDSPNGLDAGGRADLALAWLAAGRRDRAQTVLGENPLAHLIQHYSYYGRLASPVTQQAQVLKALVQLDPKDAHIAPLVKGLLAERKQGVWSSTLANAEVLSALAQYEATLTRAPADFKGQVQFGTELTAEFDHRTTKTLRYEKLLQPWQLETTGKGECHITLTTTGLRTAPQVADSGLKVRRRWLDRSGQDIEPRQIKAGDLIVAEIELRGLTQDVPNVVIVDSLPSGFEVENPRLAISANQRLGSQAEEEPQPDRIEFRDDRVLIFGEAHVGYASRYRYLVRATTPGQFEAPGIQAVSMYSPDLVSIGPTTSVVIKP